MSSNRVILVTGGAGYIGTSICKSLLDHGFKPIIIDTCEFKETESKIWGTLIKGNILDQNLLDKTFKEYKPSVVIHLASYMDVHESVINPEKYYNNNLQGSITLLNAIKTHSIKHLIFASSSSVYGELKGDGLKEEETTSPLSPYAAIKCDIEKLIDDYSKAYNFNYINFRYFNVAGIDSSAGYRYCAHKSLSLIPLILKNIYVKGPSISVYGHEFRTPDKTGVRDYIHITDLVAAHILALDYLEKNKPSQTLNLGSGKGVSILEVINKCKEITGQKIDYHFEKQRPGEIGKSRASMEKIERILNFKPIHSGLAEIVKSVWSFFNTY